MLLRKIKTLYRLLTTSPHGLPSREYLRLARAPRFIPSQTTFRGRPTDIVDAVTLLVGAREIFEGRIYDFATENKTPRIIDCGANIGLSVLFFKELYPESIVVAFEADPQICDVLRRNLANWNLTGVEVHQKAIWHEETTLEFFAAGGYGGRVVKPGDTQEIISVATARLKTFLDQKTELLKIDIEGAELEVLEDCEAQLNCVERIFIEYHSHEREPQKLDALLSLLARAGFRYYIQEASGPRHPFLAQEAVQGMDLQLNIFGVRVAGQAPVD